MLKINTLLYKLFEDDCWIVEHKFDYPGTRHVYSLGDSEDHIMVNNNDFYDLLECNLLVQTDVDVDEHDIFTVYELRDGGLAKLTPDGDETYLYEGRLE